MDFSVESKIHPTSLFSYKKVLMNAVLSKKFSHQIPFLNREGTVAHLREIKQVIHIYKRP